MQNILNIKEKLETQARNEFAEMTARLNEELDKLDVIKRRKEEYELEAVALRESAINIRDINDNKYALDRMDDLITAQELNVKKAEKNLDIAREKLKDAMQETKIHTKLREKAFEQFKKDLIAEESKEVDELTSYTYGQRIKDN